MQCHAVQAEKVWLLVSKFIIMQMMSFQGEQEPHTYNEKVDYIGYLPDDS